MEVITLLQVFVLFVFVLFLLLITLLCRKYLDINYVALLVDAHVCSQRNNSCWETQTCTL